PEQSSIALVMGSVMGGLRKAMPFTFLTFLASTIAIAGIPGFSGFFSKDEILWQAFANPLPRVSD
ncbi:proton-conducting transporter membrane subunit, partial [Proteus mirabilis]|uniref:proton-conducting transporter transmembrane domain-containing protein n=1 Tax=Proteus mirabilis TaxID=584 RepID=UPI001952F94B